VRAAAKSETPSIPSSKASNSEDARPNRRKTAGLLDAIAPSTLPSRRQDAMGWIRASSAFEHVLDVLHRAFEVAPILL
jgi:hypothetical protein